MDPAVLARQVVAVLVRLLMGPIDGAASRAAEAIYDTVAGRLRRSGETSRLDALEGAPRSSRQQADLAAVLARHIAADSGLAEQLTNGVRLALDQSQMNVQRNVVSASGGGIAGGRDVSVDNSKRKTNYGGIVVGVVAVAVVIAILSFGGRAVYLHFAQPSGASSGLNANSTCRDFLAADTADQVQIMKTLYLQANKPQQAGDPFILQNADYDCGQLPDDTLGQVVGLTH